jgi:DNA-binding MarR family transcriptional regulator
VKPLNKKEIDFIHPNEINSLIHEPTRLMILSHLFVSTSADLIYFKRKTDSSWGNISTHASKLEEAGYIEILKTFRNKKPLTVLKMTEKGKIMFAEYINVMKRIIGD